MRAVALQGFQPLRQLLDAQRNRARLELAHFLDRCGVTAPQLTIQIALGLDRSLRRAVGKIGLGKAFVGADADHIGRHAEPVERILVVIAIAAEAFDHHATHRVQIDLVGLCGEEIAALAVVVAIGEQRLATGLETGQPGSHLMQAGQTGAAEIIKPQRHRADLVVFGRGFQRPQHIAQPRLLLRLPLHLGHQLFARRARKLLDQRALQIQHQGRLVLQGLGPARGQPDNDRNQQRQQQQVQQHPARAVEQPPAFAQHPAERLEE